MLATLADVPLQDARLVYEPKYDGIRALVEVAVPADGRARVRIWSRAGNEKTSQFPEIVAGLMAWAARRRCSVMLDGEIVAVDPAGTPMGFQRLQDRMHMTVGADLSRLSSKRPAVLIAFDLLLDDGADLRGLPLTERRARLEAALSGGERPDVLRVSQVAVGDGTALYRQAQEQGWEGLIAKVAASTYRSGQRGLEWRKIKLFKRQEFVIGGWTEPRRSRARFGALLLGEHQAGAGLRYVGHAGSGFTEKDLRRLGDLLDARAVADCPFTARPAANERPHWVKPDLVAEVQYFDRTDDGILRHAVYLGLRDDVSAAAVRREEKRGAEEGTGGGGATGKPRQPQKAKAKGMGGRTPTATLTPTPTGPETERSVGAPPTAASGPTPEQLGALLAALEAIEAAGAGGGSLQLPGGVRLDVTNLNKKLWPQLGITKGEMLRYYVRVAPYILPVVRDRPLVMRRLPNGIDAPAFYQQRGPAEAPPGVRVETLAGDQGVPSRLVGGSLATLLYMAQIAAISQDPWFSRVQSTADADFAAIDLDPGPGATFSRVLDVARWTREELDALGVIGFPKTSGVSGLHIYIPLPPGTAYASGMLFCQIVATLVAGKHPREATVERTVDRRAPDAVYVDYLQNIEGKTIACAYSARSSDYAGASTPLEWSEVAGPVDPRAFTIRTLPARLQVKGDLWAKLRLSKGVDLEAALDRVRAKHGKKRP